MRLRQTFFILVFSLASRGVADTYLLTSPPAVGITVNPGESMRTTYISGGGCGFTPTHQVDGNSYYYYGPVVTGTYATGAYNFLLWTNQPGGGISNVQVDFGYVNADGSAYVPEGSNNIDVNLSGLGNHITTYTYPAIPALVLTNQRLRLRITQGPGGGGNYSTMAYNACVDFDTRLLTPALAPFGTPTVSPTITMTPTPTLTPVPALSKSVNTGLAVVGQTITYTLNYKNPNPNSPSSCQDDFESASTQWPAGWSAPTGATWSFAADNGPSLAGTQALDAVDAGGYYFSTFNCASPATDGSIQVDVNEMTAAGEFTILWRQNGNSTYQLHVTQGTSANLELRVTTNAAPNTIQVASANIAVGAWHTYKFQVIGFNLKGYVDGTLLLNGVDPNNTFNSGNAGIEIDSGGVPNHVRYDNVIVNNYAANWYNVSLVDTLPAGLTYVSNSCGGVAVGNVVTINLGVLNAATSGSCSIVAVTNSCPATLANVGEIQVGLPAHIEQSNSVSTTVTCFTATPTYTNTLNASPTITPTYSPSVTPTVTQTVTGTRTPTATPSMTPTATPSRSPTFTPSVTQSATQSATLTSTPSVTSSSTPSATPSRTSSVTPTASPTMTPTMTLTPTQSATLTPTPSITWSFSPSPTFSATPTVTLSATTTATKTETITFSSTPTPSDSASPTPSHSPSGTFTATSSQTLTASPSVTPTESPSFSVTATFTPSFSDSPTPSMSPTTSLTLTVTPTPVPVPFQVKIGIYNSAGEKVRGLYSGSAQTSGMEAKLSSSAILGGQPVTLQFQGQLLNGATILNWSGENDQGQLVSAGIYYMRVESVDVFGKSTSVILAISVLGPSGVSSVTIYNSAGEAVGSLALPAGFGDVASVKPAQGSAAVGQGLPPVQFTATNVSGTSTTLGWNGKNSSGNYVSGGTYSVQVNSSGKGSNFHESGSFSVLDNSDSVDLKPRAKNPVSPGEKYLSLRFNPPPSGVTTLYVYNTVGELIGTQMDQYSSGRCDFDVSRLAGGIYVCVLAPQGSSKRAAMKVAILR